MYVILAKLLMYFKYKFHDDLDYDDPFQTLLRSSEDFLGNDNYILMCVTLQVINIEMLAFAAWYLFRETERKIYRNEILYFQIPLTCVLLFMFCVFVWKGTHFQIFFSKTNLITFVLAGMIFFIANIALIFVNGYPEELDLNTKFDIYFIKFLNTMNILYLMVSWLYFGHF